MPKTFQIYMENDQWILDKIEIPAGRRFAICSPHKEAIIFFPPGITTNTVYELGVGEECTIQTTGERKKPCNKIVKEIKYNFAVIVDYKNTEEPQAAMYAYSNSVCKIKIDY